MIRINLLPSEMRVSETKLNPAFVVVGVLAGLLLILLPMTLSSYSTRNRLQAESKSLQSQLDRYAPIIAQIESLENSKRQLQQRKSLIQQLEGERLRYPQFMTDFLKLLPANVWLTNLATTLQNDLITVNMDVLALDNYAIADLVSNLEVSQLFTDVDLGAITATALPSGPTLSFHITTTYRKQAGSYVSAKS